MESSTQAEDRPWLALPYHSNRGKECSMSFKSVSSNKVYDHVLACAGRKNICGSSSGFLIMVDETSEITMIDPLTNARFILPPILTSLEAKHSTDIDSAKSLDARKYPVHKAVLSSPPDCNPYDYILLVIYGEERELAYYNALSQNWIKIQEAGRYYDDIIFHMGEFYAVDEYGKVILCQPGFPPNIDEIAMPWLLRGNKIYLVGIGNELCVVVRFLKDNPDVGYKTYNFEVYLLESYEERMHMGKIDNWVFFLGQNGSMALPTKVVKGLKGNCIYFTDDNLEAYKYGVIGGHDLGVFDRGEERFQPLQCCQRRIQSAWPRPVWLTQ
ncbi:F-box protein SKIP23-like [Durio zibethinus]|uniref:F-box protein SKIP23-like n=1 Tax=Durio zibethinus TaxID=66656 RepID=A0A6P6AWQ5_DURZI|nr:F-box protein SKIP23-like [Durio zibethinus]